MELNHNSSVIPSLRNLWWQGFWSAHITVNGFTAETAPACCSPHFLSSDVGFRGLVANQNILAVFSDFDNL